MKYSGVISEERVPIVKCDRHTSKKDVVPIPPYQYAIIITYF